MANNQIVTNKDESFSNNINSDYSVETIDQGGGVHRQVVQIGGVTLTTLRLDEGATYTYIGEATPGALTSASVWRVRRITNADTTILYADGDADFDNVWDDRTSLVYS